MPDDLRSRLAAHPLLDELTNRQLDAIVEIARRDQGRDIESDILRVLANTEMPLTVEEIGVALELPAVELSVIEDHLEDMRLEGWYVVTTWNPPYHWEIDDGLRVAEARGLVRRAEG